RPIACAAKSAPSAFTPGSAANSDPGPALRESTASARTSTSAASGGTSAPTPANSSRNNKIPPTLRVVDPSRILRLSRRRQSDLHPCPPLDNGTCARRLRHGPSAAAQFRLERRLGQPARRRPGSHPGDVRNQGLPWPQRHPGCLLGHWFRIGGSRERGDENGRIHPGIVGHHVELS